MSITIQNSSIDASTSQLSINVSNGSSSASLVAKSDGTLQYANKNIVKFNGISADASGNVNISTSGNLPFAEQGAVNDTEPELQPSSRHPTVLRRTQQRDGLLLDFSSWNYKAQQCFRRTRRHSRYTYLQTKHHCFYQYRRLQRGLHSYPTTGYHSRRGTLQTSLNIHSIQRCNSSLLVSYRRASYA